MKFSMYQDTDRDFWSQVDSSLSPVMNYECTCPDVPDHLSDCGTNGPGWMQARESIGCTAMRSDRTRCKSAAQTDAPLCDLHMEKAARWFAQTHAHAFQSLLSDAEDEYVDNIMRAAQVADLDAEVSALKSRVYFIGIGDDIVKIGRSVRPETRLMQIRQGSSLMPSGYDRKKVELLGDIPGGNHVEMRLHRLLQPWRLAGEWFQQSREVTAVMAYLLGGEMSGDARRVFIESINRPWWVQEGYLSEADVEAGDAA